MTLELLSLKSASKFTLWREINLKVAPVTYISTITLKYYKTLIINEQELNYNFKKGEKDT